MIRPLALAGAIALPCAPAYANCTHELAAIDSQLAAAAVEQPQLTQVLQQLRDQGAAACKAGDETSAGANFMSVTMMLELQARQGLPSPPAPADESRPQAPARPAQATAPDASGGSGLLPLVVENDPQNVDAIDWPSLRQSAGTHYPSRWDDLTLVNSCLWISPEELAEHLDLKAKLTVSYSDFQCKYRAHLANGSSGVFLSLYIELHPDTKYPRESEQGFASGAPSIQFTPFDAGAPDLNVYVHKKSHYLYAFPANGRSYWRIGYKPPYGLDGVYLPPAGSGIEEEVGPRFMQLLVEKYAGQL